MATYRRPGIYVDEVLNPTTAQSGQGGSIAAFVGTNNRGPTTPTLVNTWADYVAWFGAFNTNFGTSSALPYAIYQFFANGGRQAYVTRVVPANAVTASITLLDGAGNVAANNVLTISAVNAGAWAGGTGYPYGLGFDVIRTGGTTRFDLNVYYFPPGVSASTSQAANAAYLVEKFQDLSMSPADARYAPAIINGSASTTLGSASYYGGSKYITVTDAGNTATPGIAPANQGVGVSSSTVPLTIATSAGVATAAVTNLNSVATLGADGTALVVGTGGSASLAYYKAVALLDQVQGNLVLNLPAVSDLYTLAQVIDYCGNRGDIFLVLDSAANKVADNTGVLLDFQPLVSGGTIYSNNPATTAANGNAPQVAANNGYAAIYYPWLTIGDPSSATPGVTRNVPPGGAVIGLYQANDALQGPWFAPAGTNMPLNVVGVERRLTNAELDGLQNPQSVYSGNFPYVNPVKIVPGAGICVFGARTLRQGYPDRYINIRRTLIDLKYNLTQLTQFALFEPNNELLWQQVSAVCSEYLMGVWQKGGLRGPTPNAAFFVKCDETTNPDNLVQNGEVHIQVGVAVQYPAEFVIISIGQFDGQTVVNEA